MYIEFRYLFNVCLWLWLIVLIVLIDACLSVGDCCIVFTYAVLCLLCVVWNCMICCYFVLVIWFGLGLVFTLICDFWLLFVEFLLWVFAAVFMVYLRLDLLFGFKFFTLVLLFWLVLTCLCVITFGVVCWWVCCLLCLRLVLLFIFSFDYVRFSCWFVCVCGLLLCCA